MADEQNTAQAVVDELNSALSMGSLFNPEMFGSMLRTGDNPILRWRDALVEALAERDTALHAAQEEGRIGAHVLRSGHQQRDERHAA